VNLAWFGIVTDWMDATPWYVEGEKFPSMKVNRAEAEELHALISSIRISPFPPMVAGIDGETHTLTLHAFFNRAQFEWFMELPECWIELQPAVDKLSSIARECLNHQFSK